MLEDSTDEDFPQPTNQLSHLELAYLTNTHYDSIIDVKSGCPISIMPILTPRGPLSNLSNALTIQD